MGVLTWVAQHWFDLLQTVGIVGGLLFTGITIEKEARARRISNSIAINQQHTLIWKELYFQPELHRVLAKERNVTLEPPSERETLFVNSLILHLSTAFRAIKSGELVSFEGLQKDVKAFFSLPIPMLIWTRVRSFHDKALVDFIEATAR